MKIVFKIHWELWKINMSSWQNNNIETIDDQEQENGHGDANPLIVSQRNQNFPTVQQQLLELEQSRNQLLQRPNQLLIPQQQQLEE